MACNSYELAYCGGVSLDDNIPCDVHVFTCSKLAKLFVISNEYNQAAQITMCRYNVTSGTHSSICYVKCNKHYTFMSILFSDVPSEP